LVLRCEGIRLIPERILMRQRDQCLLLCRVRITVWCSRCHARWVATRNGRRYVPVARGRWVGTRRLRRRTRVAIVVLIV